MNQAPTLITADKRLFLRRTAEHIDKVIRQFDDLRDQDTDDKCSELSRNPKAQEAEASIRGKINLARRKLAESRIGSAGTWSTDKRELSGMLAEIIIDIGCLRVRTGTLEVRCVPFVDGIATTNHPLSKFSEYAGGLRSKTDPPPSNLDDRDSRSPALLSHALPPFREWYAVCPQCGRENQPWSPS